MELSETNKNIPDFSRTVPFLLNMVWPLFCLVVSVWFFWGPHICGLLYAERCLSSSLIGVYIGPESDHLATLVTHSLTWVTDSCFVGLIDVTLACEDANSKLVEVVKVADADSEKRLDDCLVQIWKLKFGYKAKFLSTLWAQGLVKSLKLKFMREFEAEGQYFTADA